MIILDASVALKWIFADEAGAEAALAIRNDHVSGKNEIAVPSLFFYEIANVLATKVKLTDVEAQAAFSMFWEFEFNLHDLNQDDLLEAMKLSHKHRISTYDANYLALANRLECTLATADRKLWEKVAEYGNVTLVE